MSVHAFDLFSIWILFFFLLSFEGSLYFLYTSLLLALWCTDIFPSLLFVLSHLNWVVCTSEVFNFFFFWAVLGLLCGARASHCSGFSCCGARALGAWASVAVACRLSSCGLWALEHGLSSCGTWA